MKKKVYWRIIINANKKEIAEKIIENFIKNIDIKAISQMPLSKYEDDNHYEITFNSEIEGKNLQELEYQAFKLCTSLEKGPWFFYKLPREDERFEFEAFFNTEAFIKNEPKYENKLKWAFLNIN